MKASDNEFAKVILKPLGLASAPADASWKLYPMADGVYARSSNSIVGPLGAGGSGAVATDVIWDAAGDLVVGTGANTAARLAIGATSTIPRVVAGTLAYATPGVIMADLLPWTIQIAPYAYATHTGWNTYNNSAGLVMQTRMQSSGTLNDLIGWDIVFGAGTWAMDLIHVTDTNRGIYSIQFDTVDKGTIDGYSATTVESVYSSVTGIVVATSAKVRFTLKMATKNASSSAYYGTIALIQWRRTA